MSLLLVALALAGPSVPPPYRLATWDDALPLPEPARRVAMIVEAVDDEPVAVQVLDGDTWRPAKVRWHRGRVSVLVVDLDRPRAALRFRSPDAARVTLLDWDAFTPTSGEPRRAAAPPPPAALPGELVAIGVTSRDAWGADPTTCTSTEDDWYRMAIHHTAGGQTYGGTVQGAVQALQAYSLGTGEYCDIPYQFLVGYDGSLWEGRPYGYYSGATGGGNNDGNIAVCFLGCYDSGACSDPDGVTDAMMVAGQLLVQTLAELHDVATDSDTIRGHRDWPGNSTACPGQELYDRLQELRDPLVPRFAGSGGALSCTPGSGASLALTTGEAGACSLTLTNAGREAWSPGTTFVAPVPRDVASPLAAPSWPSTTRAATVAASTDPGATGTFTFDVVGAAAGAWTLSLGLLQEGDTWFADDGGPADGALAVTVTVTDAPVDTDAPVVDDTAPGPDDGEPLAPGAPPGALVRMDEAGGCSCSVPGGGGPGPLVGPGLLLGTVLAARRRRRGAPRPIGVRGDAEGHPVRDERGAEGRHTTPTRGRTP